MLTEIKVSRVIRETPKSWEIEDAEGGRTYLAFSMAEMDRTEADGVVFLVKSWLAKKIPSLPLKGVAI
jgi:hypothetical protein